MAINTNFYRNRTIATVVDVDQAGVLWTFRSPGTDKSVDKTSGQDIPQSAVTILNESDSTNNVFVGINETITNAGINDNHPLNGYTASDGIYNAATDFTVGNFPVILAADAVVRGHLVAPGESITIRSKFEDTGEQGIQRVWAICATGETATVRIGNVESS